MKFCSDCGGNISLAIPAGDDRERFTCDNCQAIHYVNPRLIVGCLPVYEGKILLCRRAIEPRRNYWTLPAGFMENGETTADGAARETWEEARARVSDLALYRIYDVPYINQVYMFFRSTIDDGSFAPGPESLECALFSEAEVPWDDLAFPSVFRAMEGYFRDCEQGNGFPLVIETILRRRDAGG